MKSSLVSQIFNPVTYSIYLKKVFRQYIESIRYRIILIMALIPLKVLIKVLFLILSDN